MRYVTTERWLLDFSAAFDCVDHWILLIKVLQHSFGICGTIINWLLSYLSNRTQHVRINFLIISSIASVLFGVPHGSVLGLLLFGPYTSALSAITFPDFGLAPKRKVWLLRTWFGIAPVNKLVSLTCLFGRWEVFGDLDCITLHVHYITLHSALSFAIFL